MIAPVSATLIVRDDPHLFKTVAELRPHVREICIAFTPYPGCDERAVRALADRFAIAPSAPGARGYIHSFADARNLALGLATEPWILWADSDDLIEGLTLLPEVLTRAKDKPSARFLCPYEYACDPVTGECCKRQWRERIVRNDGRFTWRNPVHEVLVAKDGRYDDIKEPRLVWKHTRVDQSLDPGRIERAIHILCVHREKLGRPDAWTEYELGVELAAARNFKGALRHLAAYLELSDWGDQKAIALLQMADCHVAIEPIGAHEEALSLVRRAIALRPEWFETHYAESKLLFLRGMTGFEGDLEHALTSVRLALSKPPTETLLPINPLDRSRFAHELIYAVHETLSDSAGSHT